MSTVHRVEVRPRPGLRDPRGERVQREMAGAGPGAAPRRVDHASVYLLRGQLTADQVQRIARELLADPVTEEAGTARPTPTGTATVEVHPLPGVMDPAAESVQLAVRSMLGVDVEVRTGSRWDLEGVDAAAAESLARRFLANTVIHAVHAGPYAPASFPVARAHAAEVREVPLLGLDDAALERLSRSAHLFLSLEEMKAIQAEYRRQGREPREIELETLAQTWSEHCVHKTLKSTIRYREAALPAGMTSMVRGASGRPGHQVEADGSLTIRNLLKSTVAAATHALMDPARPGAIDWCLSVFVDNAGVIAFDEQRAVCFKVETHNHPSALEPYGGAATGIGGCIRDVMGTGLGAKPIAATDVFCVAEPDMPAAEVPEGCLPPARILRQVVAGVRDYGNRMGIPTVNGAVWFDRRHVGNPLVFCGVVGVMPRSLVRGAARSGDRIIAIGGRTGRDGIHGATFSSAELTDTHADEFSHAVQIGNAITEKKCLDLILAARDADDGPLYHAITDCGAGGFSSAVGEMGGELGAEVDLERAPLKYAGLSPTEVWISEAQERMVLAVPADSVAALADLCELHEVEWCDLGAFGTPDRSLRLRWHGQEVGRLDMHFLHEGIPTPVREALWDPAWAAAQALSTAGSANGSARAASAARADGGRAGSRPGAEILAALEDLLAHPNVSSKAWIIRQYDHEVQGGSAVKPLVGARAEGPGDAAVVVPPPVGPDADPATKRRGVAIANGLATGLEADPWLMGLAAIDECVRNLVCVGADPTRVAILDNFCWPSCRDPRNLGALVRAAEACLDGGLAYGVPFISGKDSLNNQFTTQDGRTIQIPPTLLISGIGIVEDVERAVTMDAKAAGNLLVLVGATEAALGGSHLARVRPEWVAADAALPRVDLSRGPALARAVHGLIRAGLVRAAHDCSEGGLLLAAAEMAFAGGIGCRVDLSKVPAAAGAALTPVEAAFSESASRYLLEIPPASLGAVQAALEGLPWALVGEFIAESRMDAAGATVPLERLRSAWLRAAGAPEETPC